VAGSPLSWGRANAPVTLAAFSDFQCPFCAKAAQSISGVEHAYGADVRIVYKYYPLPFHTWAMPAAKAAACVHAQDRTGHDEGFWKLHDYYFKHQPDLDEVNVVEKSLDVAKTIPGFSVAAYKRCIAAPATEASIRRDIALGAGAQVGGTPTFFVNGERVNGIEDVKKAIAGIRAGGPRTGKSTVQ
jgi:protein-disulfide isomerase